MAFPTVQARATGRTTASNVTSHAITLPSNIARGELLLVVFSVDGNPTITINTATSGNNWKLGTQASYSTTVTGVYIWKIAEGSDVLTLTTSASEQSSHVSFRILGGVHVGGTSANGDGTNSNPVSHTAAWTSQDYLLIATRTGDSTVVASAAPTGYSNLQTIAAVGTSSASTNTAEKSANGSSEDPGVFTSDTEQWVTFTLAIAPPVGLVTDNFDAYSAAALGGQGDWVACLNTINVIDSSGNKVINAGTDNSESCAYINKAFSPNHRAKITIPSVVDWSYIGVAVRISGSGATVSYYLYYRTSSGVCFGVVVNGTWDEIVPEFAKAFSANDTMELRINGSVIECYYNGVLDSSMANAESPATGTAGSYTDTRLTTGLPGVSAFRLTHCDTFGDNFEACDIGILSVLSIADSTHSHTAESPVITQNHVLAIANGSHSHTAGIVAVTQNNILVTANGSHAHTTDSNLIITQNTILVIGDCVHSHTSESPAIEQQVGEILLQVGDGIHLHTSESPAITQDNILIIDDTLHSHISDDLTITQDHTLIITDCSHSHISEEPVISQVHVLSINNCTHDHASENIVLTQNHVLAVDNCEHSHAAENISLLQNHILAIEDCVHSHLSEDIAITQDNFLAVYDCEHSHISEDLIIVQDHVLSISECEHNHTSDDLIIEQQTGTILLQIDDCAHLHTSDDLEITQEIVDILLVIDDCTHNHLSDNVVLSQNQILSISDCVHVQNAENVLILLQFIAYHILEAVSNLNSKYSDSSVVLSKLSGNSIHLTLTENSNIFDKYSETSIIHDRDENTA
jgi:hypothetical protein